MAELNAASESCGATDLVMPALRQRGQRLAPPRRRVRRTLPPDVIGLAVAGSPFAGPGPAVRPNEGFRETVVGLLFVHPDAPAMEALRNRRRYFDHRTGDSWDLFFPGYVDTSRGAAPAEGAVNVGGEAETWWFEPAAFDAARGQIERECTDGWRYSGEADLVLAGAWVPSSGSPTIDWRSAKTATLDESNFGNRPISLSNAVEVVTRDLKAGGAAERYGLETFDPESEAEDGFVSKLTESLIIDIMKALIVAVASLA